MNKVQPSENDSEMREEYDFSGGVQGKYADRFSGGSTLVILDLDVEEVFSDVAAVNDQERGD
jgi:hypothetical protein